jgi:hypothetical protein
MSALKWGFGAAAAYVAACVLIGPEKVDERLGEIVITAVGPPILGVMDGYNEVDTSIRGYLTRKQAEAIREQQFKETSALNAKLWDHREAAMHVLNDRAGGNWVEGANFRSLVRSFTEGEYKQREYCFFDYYSNENRTIVATYERTTYLDRPVVSTTVEAASKGVIKDDKSFSKDEVATIATLAKFVTTQTLKADTTEIQNFNGRLFEALRRKTEYTQLRDYYLGGTDKIGTMHIFSVSQADRTLPPTLYTYSQEKDAQTGKWSIKGGSISTKVSPFIEMHTNDSINPKDPRVVADGFKVIDLAVNAPMINQRDVKAQNLRKVLSGIEDVLKL